MYQEVAPTHSLAGSVERVTYYNQENGFCVLRVKVADKHDVITVVGYSIAINPGEYVECHGQWFNDKSYGLQFKFTQINIIYPNTLDGIEKYLGSGLIKGIGPGFAKRLVTAFGVDVFNVIAEEPDKLMGLAGIGRKRKAELIQAFREQNKIREIMVFLHSHGVGTARAIRIYKTYGEDAISLITENPYRLSSDIRGIGFKTADALAISLGIAKDSLLRAKAGVIYVLQKYSNKGNCAALVPYVFDIAVNDLDMPSSQVEKAIIEEVGNNNIIYEEFPQEIGLFLPEFYQAEIAIAKKIQALQHEPAPWSAFAVSQAIPLLEKNNEISLSSSQRQAIELAVSHKLSIITGGPGVGKTTVINILLQIINSKTQQILLCAPTGRAAKRLSESTAMQAKTLHRLLEYSPRTLSFNYNENNPLPAKFIVIDESSMVDLFMMNNLLKAVPLDCSVVFVGDVDQLPSVGPGAVLADFISSQTIPCVHLTEIFRQAASSQIIVNAHLINQRKIPDLVNIEQGETDFYFIEASGAELIKSKLLKVVGERISSRFGFDRLTQVQVLTPMNVGGLGTRALNVELKKILNPAKQEIMRYGTAFSQGDKVIQVVNNYNKDVFNGDIGFISYIDIEESRLEVVFEDKQVEYEFNELDELNLAYAISIHKSQGCEYPVVVMPLAMQHFSLLTKNLIYTAITRGKQLVVIIGQKSALASALKTKDDEQRLTKLAERLQTNYMLS